MSSLVPIVNLPSLYVNNCQINVLNGTTVTIGTGQLRDYTNVFDIVVNTPLTIKTTFVGAGGLDTGTVANNAFYAVYVISDPTNKNPPAGLLSLSSSQPVQPSVNNTTYGTYRLVGYVLTNGSGQLLNSFIAGNGNLRVNVWEAPINVLNAGTQTAFTPISLAAAVPSGIASSDSPDTHVEVMLETSIIASSPGGSISIIPGGSSATNAVWQSSGSVITIPTLAQVTVMSAFTGSFYSIQYKNFVLTSSTLLVTGFRYYL